MSTNTSKNCIRCWKDLPSSNHSGVCAECVFEVAEKRRQQEERMDWKTNPGQITKQEGEGLHIKVVHGVNLPTRLPYHISLTTVLMLKVFGQEGTMLAGIAYSVMAGAWVLSLYVRSKEKRVKIFE